jgi:hypothetical protein
VVYRNWEFKEIYVTQTISHILPPGFWIHPLEPNITVLDACPPDLWDKATNTLQPLNQSQHSNFIGAIQLRVRDHRIVLLLGVHSYVTGGVESTKPWCKLRFAPGKLTLAALSRVYDPSSNLREARSLAGTDVSDEFGLKASIKKTNVSSAEMYAVQLISTI